LRCGRAAALRAAWIGKKVLPSKTFFCARGRLALQ
jgi:hypothetical protein